MTDFFRCSAIFPPRGWCLRWTYVLDGWLRGTCRFKGQRTVRDAV